MWQCPVCGEYATGGSCANCEANGLNGNMLTYYTPGPYIRILTSRILPIS